MQIAIRRGMTRDRAAALAAVINAKTRLCGSDKKMIVGNGRESGGKEAPKAAAGTGDADEDG